MYARVVGKGCLAVAIAAMAGLAITAVPSAAQDVRIGELNSYSRMAATACSSPRRRSTPRAV
jgi:hypothetical protein